MPATPLTLYAKWQKNGTVGVNFSLPDHKAVVFTFDGEVVSSMSVPRGDTLPLIYSDPASLVSGWKWYRDGAHTVTTSSYDLPIGANGRYVVSCTAVYNGVLYAGSVTVTVTDALTVRYNGNGADWGRYRPHPSPMLSVIRSRRRPTQGAWRAPGTPLPAGTRPPTVREAPTHPEHHFSWGRRA